MNPTPQAASKYNEIVEKINYFIKILDFSEFDIKLLKKEAEAIKENVDVAIGFSLLGMIAFLENDIILMHSYFKRAIEQSGNDPGHLVSYARALFKIGNFREAYKYALEVYEKKPVKEYLDVLINSVAALNKRGELKKYTEEWQKLVGEKHECLMLPLHISEYPNLIQPFIGNYPEVEKIQNLCDPALIRFFGAPLNVRLEIMQDSSHEDKLVSWIQWFGNMDDGLARYDQFEDWYIENDYDLKTDRINFNIEFVEE